MSVGIRAGSLSDFFTSAQKTVKEIDEEKNEKIEFKAKILNHVVNSGRPLQKN